MSRERYLRPTERSVANHDASVEDVEQQLRQALSLEPSPDFARHVRTRIEQTSSHRLPAVVRWQAALAAAAVCVLAVGTGWHLTRERAVPPSVALRPATDVELAPTPRSAVRPPPPRTPARVVTRTAPVAPEIIVPADRALALGRLLALTRSGAVNEESLRPVVVAAAPATLEVAPLVIPPISVPEVDTGGAPHPAGPVTGNK